MFGLLTKVTAIWTIVYMFGVDGQLSADNRPFFLPIHNIDSNATLSNEEIDSKVHSVLSEILEDADNDIVERAARAQELGLTALNSVLEISDGCLKDMGQFLQSLVSGEQWALRSKSTLWKHAKSNIYTENFTTKKWKIQK